MTIVFFFGEQFEYVFNQLKKYHIHQNKYKFPNNLWKVYLNLNKYGFELERVLDN